MYSKQVIGFWFKEIDPGQWWKKNVVFDQLIATRFGECHAAAIQCELDSWRSSPTGRLAEIIVLDQFSRNMFRGDRRSFLYDSLALALAQEAIVVLADKKMTSDEKQFLYMPFMHSESRQVHETAVRLFKDAGLTSNYEFELKHKVIIDRFGRYPHRNTILGRESTPEEIRFLKQPGSSF